jgi:predicted permease
MMREVYSDVRLAVRSLMKQPGFAAVAILTLALGIGSTSAMFSVFKAVVLQPLPFNEPERLVQIWENDTTDAREQNPVSTHNFRRWQEQRRVISHIGAYWTGGGSLAVAGDAEEIELGGATGELFATLQTRPLLGRLLREGDDVAGNENVAVLSYELWQRRFGGDRNVIGRSIKVAGDPFTVVGVLPREFLLANSSAELWVGLELPTEPPAMRGRFLHVVGRLARGVSIEQARAHMDEVAKVAQAAMPDHNRGMLINLVPLHEQIVGDVQRPLTIVLASVGILLLIACVNVANLLLSRASTRRKEMAIRAALGASRSRMIRQLLTESVVLSIIGAVLGLLLAAWGTALLVRFIADAALLPRIDEISVDGVIVAVTAVIAIVTAMLFGLAPAIEASRTDLQNVLRSTSRGSTHGRGGKRFRDLLVGSEIALAVVLLISAGLLLKSFNELLSVDAGVKTEGRLTMRVEVPSSTFPEEHHRFAFYEKLFQQVRTLPGVTHVGATQHMPFRNEIRGDGFKVEGRALTPGQDPSGHMRMVGGDYFAAMGMRVISGRVFEPRDNARLAFIVNEAMVKKHFPNENPIGRRLSIAWNPGDPDTPGEIVGVVNDVRQSGLNSDVSPALYINYPLNADPQMTLIIASSGDPETLAAPITRMVRTLAPEATVADVMPLEDVVMKTVARPKFNASLLTIFSALGLILAAIGVYGVLSYSVSQRTQEIGVRMALGAQPKQVMQFVSREGMTIAVIGLAIGTVAALIATRVLQSLLYGVSATDPAVFAVVWVVVAGVAFLAVYLPARRATRVDPLVALRTE